MHNLSPVFFFLVNSLNTNGRTATKTMHQLKQKRATINSQSVLSLVLIEKNKIDCHTRLLKAKCDAID